MHVRGRRVARSAAVDDGDPPPGAAQDQRGAQTGGAAPNHNHVIPCVIHGPDAAEVGRKAATFVAVSGNAQ